MQTCKETLYCMCKSRILSDSWMSDSFPQQIYEQWISTKTDHAHSITRFPSSCFTTSL